MNIKGVLWCIKTIYTCMFNNNCRPIDVKCKKKIFVIQELLPAKSLLRKMLDINLDI